VQTFSNIREAKEFLVSRIVTEAQREGVSLSEIERKMMYFSETGCSLPDIMDVSDAFDRDYDMAVYEEKVGKLIRNFCADSRKNNRDDFLSWKEAVRGSSSRGSLFDCANRREANTQVQQLHKACDDWSCAYLCCLRDSLFVGYLICLLAA
jgi:hypothetical protein